MSGSDEEQRRALVPRQTVAIDVHRVGINPAAEPARQPSRVATDVAQVVQIACRSARVGVQYWGTAKRSTSRITLAVLATWLIAASSVGARALIALPRRGTRTRPRPRTKCERIAPECCAEDHLPCVASRGVAISFASAAQSLFHRATALSATALKSFASIVIGLLGSDGALREQRDTVGTFNDRGDEEVQLPSHRELRCVDNDAADRVAALFARNVLVARTGRRVDRSDDEVRGRASAALEGPT